MPDLIIKPEATSGNKLILKDQAGGAVLTTADSGVTVANATLTTPTVADMSNCTFPAGHVLQVKHYTVTEVNALTTSYVNYWENAITLKSGSSDVFVTCSFNVWMWDGAGMGMKIYRKEGSSVATSDTAVWTKNTVDGTGPLTLFFNPSSGEMSFVTTFTAQDSPSQDVGDTLYYALFMRKRNTANVSVGNNYTEDGWMSMQLMEVQK